MKKNYKKIWLFAAVGAVFGVLGAQMAMKQNTPNPVTTTIAPTGGAPHTATDKLFAQALPDAAGKQQELSQWKGKALVVNFWAPWCAPCVREMPELAALADELRTRDVNVIGIGIDSPANIAQFAQKFRISYPLYVAGMSGTDLAREFGNQGGGLPYTVLIGADGQVRKTYLGELRFDQLRADLAAL